MIIGGEDCELSGVYECAGYYGNTEEGELYDWWKRNASYTRYRGWWVKDGKQYNTPNGHHKEQFQIWFNEGEWRLGYTSNYWYVNKDANNWMTSQWIPQKGGDNVTVMSRELFRFMKGLHSCLFDPRGVTGWLAAKL